MKIAPLMMLVVALGTAPAWGQVPHGKVRGHIKDTSQLPLPGVTVTMTAASSPASSEVVVTDETGLFEFDVPYGRYTLAAELSGFEKAIRRDLAVSADPLTVDLTLSLAGFTEETQVIGQLPRLMSSGEPTAPATMDKDVIKIAPVQGLRYDSALPLLPTAVRGPDGLIALGGARATQGTVLVDLMRENDPVSGEPVITVPIAAIETVQVFAPTPTADLGPGSAGVTLVNTRRGADAFTTSISTFVPRPRFGGGPSAINGIESWQPNVGINGPIARGRAWFVEAIEYRWERFQNLTPSGAQDTKLVSFSSFTRVDARIAGSSLLTWRVALVPENRQHVGLDAFNPASSVPDLRSRPVSSAAVARVAVGNDTIEVAAHVKSRRLDVLPVGDDPYSVGHDSVRGSFYRSASSLVRRIETSAVWTHRISGQSGEHIIRAGVAASRANVRGTTTSRLVTYLRSDETVSSRVEFVGAGALETAATEAGGFVQDAWSPGKRVTINGGARFDYAGVVHDRGFWPRADVSYKLDARTTIGGGGGVFADRAPLGISTFSQGQTRRVDGFDSSGTSVVTSSVFANVTGHLAMARATIAYVQVDRTIGRNWTLRASLQARHGIHEPTVNTAGEGAEGALLLESAGESHARSVELTAGYHSGDAAQQFYVSYVRSASTGNLNDLQSVTAPSATALVLPDALGPLAADVPHRLMAWGIIALPWRLTIAPFAEFRTGFPFSPIGDDWYPVGLRNSARYPSFASLDLAAEKALKLWKLPPLRVGVKVFNITGHDNGRNIQADVERADYGQTRNPVRRQFRASLEIVWNKG